MTLRDDLAGATPGPWKVYDDKRPGIDSTAENGPNIVYAARFAGEFAGIGRAEDARAIVSVMNAAPALLDVAEAAREAGNCWFSLADDEAMRGQMFLLRAALDRFAAIEEKP